MKTEISGQNFPKIFACGGQFSLTTLRTEISGQTLKTEIPGQNFRLRRAIFLIKFVIKFGDAAQRQSSIWTKISLNCVQKT